MEFLKHATRNLFFTGKGGAGKTSVACATAVRPADSGRRVLLVSTDPASNLDEVSGTALQHHPVSIPSIPNLSAMNPDPEKSAAEYREHNVSPCRTLLTAAVVAGMEAQFSGSCTLEIAAFDEFSGLLGDASATSRFDHIVFDTAPTTGRENETCLLSRITSPHEIKSGQVIAIDGRTPRRSHDAASSESTTETHDVSALRNDSPDVPLMKRHLPLPQSGVRESS